MADLNYRVKCTHFGKYERGAVVPGWFVRAGNDPAALIAAGMIEETSAAPTVTAEAPVAVPDVSPDLVAERNELFQKHAAAALDVKLYAGKCEELERHNAGLKAELLRLTTQATDLTAALAEREKELAAAHDLLNEKK